MQKTVRFEDFPSRVTKSKFLETQHFPKNITRTINNKGAENSKMSFNEQNLKSTQRGNFSSLHSSKPHFLSPEKVKVIDRATHDHSTHLSDLHKILHHFLSSWFAGLKYNYIGQTEASRFFLPSFGGLRPSLERLGKMKEALIESLNILRSSHVHERLAPEFVDLDKLRGAIRESENILNEFMKSNPDLFIEYETPELSDRAGAALKILKMACCSLKKVFDESFDNLKRDFECFNDSSMHQRFFRGKELTL